MAGLVCFSCCNECPCLKTFYLFRVLAQIDRSCRRSRNWVESASIREKVQSTAVLCESTVSTEKQHAVYKHRVIPTQFSYAQICKQIYLGLRMIVLWRSVIDTETRRRVHSDFVAQHFDKCSLRFQSDMYALPISHAV